MKLTKRSIDALEYDPDGPTQQIYWDDRLENFGVRVYPTGAKSFVIRYRNAHGRRRYITIGKFGRWTLQQAQSEALQLFALIDEGGDPAAPDPSAQVTLITELADLFIEKHCKPRRKTWRTDRARVENHIKPIWQDRKIDEIGRGEVAELHRTIGNKTPVEANRVVALLVTMYNFAQREGIVPDGHNPARHINRYRETSRERWLRPHEISRLAPHIDAVENPYLRYYYWTMLLTAARRDELRTLRWEHVDFDRAEIFFPKTKNGSSHTVPLSSAAISILRQVPRQTDNPWVFCGHIRGEHIVDVNHPWMDVRRAAGLDDVVLHDLRRTAASWLAQSGYSMLVIQKILNHTVDSVTGIYARLRPEAVRAALEDYGNQVMAARHGGGENVVPLVAGRSRK